MVLKQQWMPRGVMLGTLVVWALLSHLFCVAQAQVLMDDPALQKPTAPQRQSPKVLQGGVSTLESVIQQEGRYIDWYGWYMGARQYLAEHGGFKCPRGTPIYFFKDGHLDTPSNDWMCLLSVRTKNFPLPTQTAVEILVLPTRQWEEPPASPEEILRRTRSATR